MNTPEGQEVSRNARRRATAEKPPVGAPRLFVVRLGAGSNVRFGWEIRKFGSFVLHRSETGFETHQEAEQAGQESLNNIHVNAAAQGL